MESAYPCRSIRMLTSDVGDMFNDDTISQPGTAGGDEAIAKRAGKEENFTDYFSLYYNKVLSFNTRLSTKTMR